MRQMIEEFSLDNMMSTFERSDQQEFIWKQLIFNIYEWIQKFTPPGEKPFILHAVSFPECPQQPSKPRLPGSRQPVAAVQPIMGGMAPTTAPTQVLLMLSLLSGV